jgi:hypothetical protein
MPLDFSLLNAPQVDMLGNYQRGQQFSQQNAQNQMQQMEMINQMKRKNSLSSLLQSSGGNLQSLVEPLARGGYLTEAAAVQSMIPKQEAYTLGEGQVRYGANNQPLAQGLPKVEKQESTLAKIDPKDYTPQSIKMWFQGGMKDPSLLVRREASGETNDVNWQTVQSDSGMVQVNPRTGQVRPLGIQAPKKASGPLSAQAQKELFEADDIVQGSKAAIGLLDEALSLNDTAYSGYGATERAIARSNLPGTSREADATIQLDNILTGQALESLKAIFGGMPTEGERKILLDIQASPNKTPSQRKAIIDRAKIAANRRIGESQAKAKALREGTYFTEAPVSEQVSDTPQQQNGVKFLGFE